jgi:hypothetical protein
MGQELNQKDRVTFKDVLLARNYICEMHDTGKLSPDLQAAVDECGRERVERVARIIKRLDNRKTI